MSKNFSVALSLLLNSAQYTQGLRTAQAATQSFRSKLISAFAPIVGIAAITASVKEMVSIVFTQTKQLDALSAGFKTVITDSDELRKTYTTLNKMSDLTGISIVTLKTEYLAFAAASKGTSLEGEKGIKVFGAITSAMSKLGSSEDATHRALVAVTQMMSKGTVASEELRGQLGEALPGAYNLVAIAMGMTTKELGKQLKLGNITAADMLPKLAEQLNKTFGGDYKIDTLTAAQGRFSSAITGTIDKLSAGDLFKGVINSATAFIKVLSGTTTMADQFDPLIQKMDTLIGTLKNATILGAAAFSVQPIINFTKALIQLSTAQATAARLQRELTTASAFSSLAARGSITLPGVRAMSFGDPAVAAQKVDAAKAAKSAHDAAVVTSASKFASVMSLVNSVLIVGAFILAGYLIKMSGVTKVFSDWYDSMYGVSNMLEGINTSIIKQQSELGELASKFKKAETILNTATAANKILTTETEDYKNAVVGLLAKFPILNSYYDENTKKLNLNADALKLVNTQITRNANIKGLDDRKKELDVTYGKTAGDETLNILDLAPQDKKNELSLMLSDIRDGFKNASISADKAKKTISDFLNIKDTPFKNIKSYNSQELMLINREYGTITTSVDNLLKATEKYNKGLEEAQLKAPISPLLPEEVKEKAKKDEEIKKTESTSKYEEKLKPETRDYTNKQAALLDSQAANKISEEEYKTADLALTGKYLNTKLKLLKQFGQDEEDNNKDIAINKVAINKDSFEVESKLLEKNKIKELTILKNSLLAGEITQEAFDKKSEEVGKKFYENSLKNEEKFNQDATQTKNDLAQKNLDISNADYNIELKNLEDKKTKELTLLTTKLNDKLINEEEFNTASELLNINYLTNKLKTEKDFGKSSIQTENDIANSLLKISTDSLDRQLQVVKDAETKELTEIANNQAAQKTSDEDTEKQTLEAKRKSLEAQEALLIQYGKDVIDINKDIADNNVNLGKLKSSKGKSPKEIKEAAKEAAKLWGETFSQGLSSLTTEAASGFGERLGKAFNKNKDAWSDFGNDILKMLGEFLINIGSALIVYGTLMEAFFADMDPASKILIGVATVIAGGILVGLSAGGPKKNGVGGGSGGSGGGGGGSTSSGGNAYPSSNQAQQNNKVVFEIKGDTLVGVLGNVTKRNKNFK